MIAAAKSALIVLPLVGVVTPLIPANVAVVLAAVAATVWVSDVAVLLLVLPSPPKTLYIVWLAYPFCPDMLRSSNAVWCCPYALWKRVLRAGYVLLAIASHASNSWSGDMLDVTRMLTGVAMIWSSKYRTFLICWISWQCLML